MARAENTELIDNFEQFYRRYYSDEIGRLAQNYPNEQRSLYVDWTDLYRYDSDLADDFLSQPEQLREYAEEALRLYDLPVDVSLGQAHVRVQNLDQSTDIREIRARHVNTMVSVQGIVRKATDVRPKIQEAAFECQRCGTLTYIPQSGGDFQEPHECQGCERQGPFQINFDQSEFVDSQKLRVQESPEGLRGGETPQSLDVHIEDDITGEVTPGDHVTVTGVLHLEQQGSGQDKSAVFDVYMDGISVTIEDEQFEEMDITDEDKQEIVELSQSEDIYEQMVDSMAPAIYGYEEEKLAMILQLFSGVTKHLPDESRIRGDLHMLLIGDPGTGKCVKGDTKVALADGTEREIRKLVEENLNDPQPIDDGVYDDVDFELPSLTPRGSLEQRRATKVWKRETPERMYRIRTKSGTELEVTPSHPLFVRSGGSFDAVRAENLGEGDSVAVTDQRRTALTDGGVRVANRAEGDSSRFLGSKVGTSRIDSIETVEPDYDWVYDLEVEGTHSYVSNGVVSHNSQMISYVQNIAPRSVYTSGKGSSSAGLCVTGDTMIHTDDGFREIRDLVTDDLPEPVADETAVEKEVGVQTFDREAGEVADANSSHVWRMPEKSCRRIETNCGKELEASVNTPVLTCGENGIEWTEISAVEAGDYVAVPKYGDLDRTAVPVRELLELTTEKLLLTDDSIALLRESLTNEFGTLRDAAAELDLSEDFIYSHLKNRHVPLEKLDRMLDAIGASRADVQFEQLMIRHGDSITVPNRFDADLMYLLGLVFGDGDISLDRRNGNRGMVRISNGDEDLLERAADIFAEKFDKRPEIERQDDRVPSIRVNSATIARLFANAGMETPKADLALAPELTTAEHADAFLRGLMDADGSVSDRDDGGSSVLLSTISETLADQIQLMLESYGVRARTRERDRRGTYELADGRTIESKHVQHFVEMYGADIDRFADAIGFGSTEKRRALERIVADDRRQHEKLPVGSALAVPDGGVTGEYHNNVRRGDHPSRSRTQSMLEDIDLGASADAVREVADADLRWDEVVTASDTGEKEVFDLTVPETHNFVGNGIVTHNTAAAVRDDFGDGQQWTLEAGALVLADQGIAAVDELDKMRCVTGDTLVHLADGRISRIRDLAREAADAGTIEELPNGRTIRDVDFEAWTMTDDGRLVKRPVTAVHEYEAPDEVTTVRVESGEELTATHDHPFFVFEDGQRVETPAAELDAGDWVYVPRQLSQPTTDGGTAVETPEPASLPTGTDPALGAVLGYLSGDGNVYYDRDEGVYGIRFINKEEELLRDFERVCREAFDTQPIRPPSEQRDDGVETVRLPGREYADAVLDAGMNLETYDEKAFPEGVTDAPSATKAAFVRALADSEGSVDPETGNVKIHSSSYELLLGVKSLLLEFGVTSQIQTREHDTGRDMYLLAITAADSLKAFDRHIGFTLDRKQSSLEAVCESASGNRTILDVIPECGDLLADIRESLRLYQSECGLNDATYCNFENGDANVSIRLARRVLDAFEDRKRNAAATLETLTDDCDWETLTEVKDRYHASQAELADGTEYTQQMVSREWGRNDDLRAVVRGQLSTLVASVADTDLNPFRSLVHGDVKWRRVESVDTATASEATDRKRLMRGQLADVLGCSPENSVETARNLLATQPSGGTWSDLRDELDRHDVSFATLADDLDVAPSTVSRWFRHIVETDRFPEVEAVAFDYIGEIREEAHRLLDAIETSAEPKVYDLTVEGTHNFVANGMVVHNSEDRSAMHEALEQQKISVSKAGINATLKSRCSLLGAANPKYGRFDQYESIGEQIDLEPALISRFDLIFTVTDQPDEEHDKRLAQHIIQTNYAGELNTQRTEMSAPNISEEEVESQTEEVAPAIDPDLLRKYIAYAKRSCFPTMTDEAKRTIEDFYVDLRTKGADEDAPVPVTARKLEALVRLSEASARVRLSDEVEQEDAERAVSITRSCLQDIGVDPETGQFDADVVETGTSKSQRDRIKNIKQLIADIEEDYDEGAPMDVVLDRAEEIGLEHSKAEHEIDKLKQKGEVYEPSTDHLRTT